MDDQYEVEDEAKLKELDQAAHAAVDSNDEAGFHAAYQELLAFVRARRARLKTSAAPT